MRLIGTPGSEVLEVPKNSDAALLSAALGRFKTVRMGIQKETAAEVRYIIHHFDTESRESSN